MQTVNIDINFTQNNCETAENIDPNFPQKTGRLVLLRLTSDLILICVVKLFYESIGPFVAKFLSIFSQTQK